MEEFTKELRRIRITLVVMAIILVFVTGNSNVTVENNDDLTPPSYFHNMVPLENGYFGILSNDAIWGDNGELKIYFFDSETNEVTLKKRLSIDDLPAED